MTRQMKIVIGLGLVTLLCRPASAQHAGHEAAAAEAEEKCVGGAAGSKCGDAAHDLRVAFDKESAKGEIKCVKGTLKNGKIKYAKCRHHKLDKYDQVAIEKKIIQAAKYPALPEKKKTLAKKLAFLDSAEKALKAKLVEIGESAKEGVEYKKAEGALKKIGSEFDESLAECAKEDAAVFACPKRD